MNKIEVCEKIKKSIRHIIIQDQSKILSCGTGAVIRADGILITARHVIEEEGHGVYNGKITAKGIQTELIEYIPAVEGLEININLPEYINPISIDLTILKPVKPLKNIDFIPLCDDLAQVGTDVIMGGFSDDISLPLDIFEKFNEKNPEMVKVKKAIDKRFKYYFRQLMFKHAIIGNIQKITFTEMDVVGANYWIDNNLTYGGSGGPLVNLNGELLGVMCKKAFTESKMPVPEKLPSGTGMALSHHLISWLLSKI
ncbi:serine protease [Patescibacteria group bacterium]|nr:serine protease [Patescibacteria group bacterium]